jgi:hypothetical protein
MHITNISCISVANSLEMVMSFLIDRGLNIPANTVA